MGREKSGVLRGRIYALYRGSSDAHIETWMGWLYEHGRGADKMPSLFCFLFEGEKELEKGKWLVTTLLSRDLGIGWVCVCVALWMAVPFWCSGPFICVVLIFRRLGVGHEHELLGVVGR